MLGRLKAAGATFLLPLAAGCHTPGEQEHAPDDAESWVRDAPACDLAPLSPIWNAEDALALKSRPTPDNLHLLALRRVAQNFATRSETACPTLTGDPADAGELAGFCEQEGWTYEGSWSFVNRSPELIREDLSNVRYADGLSTGITFSGSGSLVITDTMLLERDLTLSVSGQDPVRDGDWTIHAREEYLADGSHLHEGTFLVTDSLGSADGWCVLEETSPVSNCAAEPWGGWIVVGTSTVVATFDPSDSCDGCANATIDGAPAGKICLE